MDSPIAPDDLVSRVYVLSLIRYKRKKLSSHLYNDRSWEHNAMQMVRGREPSKRHVAIDCQYLC